MRRVLYVDGGCAGNGQKEIAARRMVAVVTDETGRVVFDGERVGGSNNIAELWAVAEALTLAKADGTREVEVRTDSKNNLAWVLGRRLGKNLNDRDAVVALKARVEILRRDVAVTLTWVPRDQNLAGHYIEQRYQL